MTRSGRAHRPRFERPRRAAPAAGRVAAACAGACVASLLPVAALAAEAPRAAAGLAQVLGSLLLILALIVGLAWIASRLRLGPRAASQGLRVLAAVPVGPKERVVLLAVGDGQALVGVGADGVRPLQLLERRVELPSGELRASELGAGEAGAGDAFGERLRTLMNAAGRP